MLLRPSSRRRCEKQSRCSVFSSSDAAFAREILYSTFSISPSFVPAPAGIRELALLLLGLGLHHKVLGGLLLAAAALGDRVRRRRGRLLHLGVGHQCVWEAVWVARVRALGDIAALDVGQGVAAQLARAHMACAVTLVRSPPWPRHARSYPPLPPTRSSPASATPRSAVHFCNSTAPRAPSRPRSAARACRCRLARRGSSSTCCCPRAASSARRLLRGDGGAARQPGARRRHPPPSRRRRPQGLRRPPRPARVLDAVAPLPPRTAALAFDMVDSGNDSRVDFRDFHGMMSARLRAARRRRSCAASFPAADAVWPMRGVRALSRN